jgi:excisionase family DNA binding protein
MPEEAHEIRISDPADMTGLEDFFPSHDKTGQEDLTLDEAAKRLNLSERTIQRRLKRGQLTGYKVNGDRGPEWRIVLEASVDTTLKAVQTSDDTTVDTEVTTDAESVSSEDTTPGATVPNVQLFQHFTSFYQDQIENLQEKLEAATYRNGYLEAELSSMKSQLLLLPDLSAKATRAESLEEKIVRMEAELATYKKGFWAKVGSWFTGKEPLV